MHSDLLTILAGAPGPDEMRMLTRGRRRAASRALHALIEALDLIDGDPDLEPTLGSLGSCWFASDQRGWALSPDCDEREEENEHGGDINDGAQDDDEREEEITDAPHDADADEPSLGAPEIHHDQRRWAQGSGGSLELDHDERPLGSWLHERRWRRGLVAGSMATIA